MNRTLLSFFSILLIPSLVSAQEIDKSLFRSYNAAFVLYSRASGAVANINPGRSAQRLSPCSTFKIYNTLIGLELGLINGPDDPWYTWDGIHRDIEGWNKDLTLREAFRVSAVPAYQILARQIGAERMKQYLEQIDYGTKDTSAGIDVFWLNPSTGTPIKISADEQVALLNKLLNGELLFSKKNILILRDIMQVAKTEKGTLYGKTGSAMESDGKWNLGWFVGFLEHNGTTYVFACNIMGGKEPSGKVARAIVEDVLRSQGLL
ncbi:MAG: class D beta-lactamase [Candidatus Omnitrophica bacterium]|nr:class D beta-lactamase [Candidatus Omnitrophota bacterium]